MANVKDGATGTVLTAPSPATSGLSLVLNSGEGARFPTAPFYVIAHPNNTIPTVSTSEKLLVSAVSTDTLTIVRAQGIYSAQSIAVGWRISNAIFQDDLNNAAIVKNEVPTGSVNGSNTAFTVASAGKVTNSLELFKNGVRMKGGGADYTETATGFTMVTAPATGTVLLCGYIVAGALQSVGTNSLITDETPTGLVNSSNTVYTTARAYIAGSLEVYINGLKQFRTTDFTETTPSTGSFTMLSAPITGDIIRAAYQYNLNPSSNSDTVDGIHANATATANQLYPLNASGKLPVDVMGTGAAQAYVATQESTTSATYVDLTTTTDTVTVTIGVNGLCLLSLYCGRYNTTATGQALMTFVASGANTIAASDTYCVGEVNVGNYQYNGGAVHLLVGLTPGSTTFKLKYRIQTTGTANFLNRRIAAIPL